MSHALIYARTVDNVNLPDTLPALTPSIENPFGLIKIAVAESAAELKATPFAAP